MRPKLLEIPSRLNILLFCAFLFSQIYLLFLFPFAYSLAPRAALTALLIATFLVLPTWYLIHEAIHDHLHQNTKLGLWLARALSVVSGVPFTGIRVAHLLHHRWNRIEEFSENFAEAETTWFSATVKYLFLILGGLYWVELLGGLALFLPKPVRLWLGTILAGSNHYMKRVYQSMNHSANYRRIRNESFWIAVSFAVSVALWGPGLRGILVGALCARAFLISFFDNSFHYDTEKNLGDNATGTRNHSLPAPWLILNFNYHWTHHKHPSAPWTELPGRSTNRS